MAALFFLVCHNSLSKSFSQFRMRQRDWYLPPIVATTPAHCCKLQSQLVMSCGMYYILVGSTYLLTTPSTVQHTNTCGNNYSQSLISALVSNSACCRPLHYSVCRLFEPPLAAELFLLSTLVGSWTWRFHRLSTRIISTVFLRRITTLLPCDHDWMLSKK